jgi:hypothetical protein
MPYQDLVPISRYASSDINRQYAIIEDRTEAMFFRDWLHGEAEQQRQEYERLISPGALPE